MNWLKGFFGGLIIAGITFAFGLMLNDFFAEFFYRGDSVNAAISAFLSTSAMAVIAGIIG